MNMYDIIFLIIVFIVVITLVLLLAALILKGIGKNDMANSIFKFFREMANAVPKEQPKQVPTEPKQNV